MSTKLTVSITGDVANSIFTFLEENGGTATRREILAHIGEITSAGPCPFDAWARRALTNLGMRKGYKKKEPGDDAPGKPTKQRLSEPERESIARVCATMAILGKIPDLSEEDARDAAAQAGVANLPKGLVSAVEAYYLAAYQTQMGELLLDKPAIVETVEVPRDISTFSNVELIGELLKRFPRYVPVIEALFAASEPASLAALDLPADSSKVVNPGPKAEPKKAIKILIAGMQGSQYAHFIERTPIRHALSEKKIQLVVIDPDRTHVNLPVVDAAIAYRPNGKVLELLQRVYGHKNVKTVPLGQGAQALEQLVVNIIG